jgi:hypothetical protein
LVATERDAAGPSTVSKEPIQQHFCWNCGRHGCQKKECPYPTNYRKTGIVWPPPPEVPPPPKGASDRQIGDWVFKYKKSHPATVPFNLAKRNLLQNRAVKKWRRHNCVILIFSLQYNHWGCVLCKSFFLCSSERTL